MVNRKAILAPLAHIAMIEQRLETKFVTILGPRLIRHIQPVDDGSAEGLVARVYRQVRRDFQLVPPLTLHSPSPTLLAGAWSILRESLIAGPVERRVREAVAGAVSRINQCPFCVDVHDAMLRGAPPSRNTDALPGGRMGRNEDPHVSSIVRWASATRSPGSPILDDPPFPRYSAPQIIGVAVTFHYINRLVDLFLVDSPIPLPKPLRWLERLLLRTLGGAVSRRITRLAPPPGDSLELLPEAELPADLDWARGNPAVAGAFARFAAVVEHQGEKILPESVRCLVRRRVQNWQGDDPTLSRQWAEEAIADCDVQYQPAARLALLTALASHIVDEKVLQDFRARHPEDESLVAVAAWAAFAAARKVGSWLHVPD